MVTFEKWAGSGEVKAEDFVDFVDFWFEPDDLICLVGIPSTGKGNRLHNFVRVDEIVNEMSDELMHDLCYGFDGYNLYFTVNPVKEHRGLHKRGGNDNVESVVGLYADFDVVNSGKDTVFRSKDEILDFLEELDIQPNIVVDSGSGGIHCYWKIEGGVSFELGSELQEQWWTYLSAIAGSRKIDRLIDMSRILRVPGSVRFPKSEDLKQEFGSVRILEMNDEIHGWEDFHELSVESHGKYKEERQKRRKANTVEGISVDVNGMSFSEMNFVANFEEIFTEEVTWDEILCPSGWTYLYEDREGRRLWARPGSDSKSATTDWEDSPDVMSLLSSSEETGLLDLKEDDIALTKFRVALRLMYNDNDIDMYNDWKEELIERSTGRG